MVPSLLTTVLMISFGFGVGRYCPDHDNSHHHGFRSLYDWLHLHSMGRGFPHDDLLLAAEATRETGGEGVSTTPSPLDCTTDIDCSNNKTCCVRHCFDNCDGLTTVSPPPQ